MSLFLLGGERGVKILKKSQRWKIIKIEVLQMGRRSRVEKRKKDE